MKVCFCLTIHGRVQGVWFRHHTSEKARELGLAGYVRNQSDGTVYAEAEGEKAAVEKWVQWCHQGPAAARVDRVEAVQIPPKAYDGFEIRQTR